MEFRYRINNEEVQSLSEMQWMLWSLDAMQKASVAREEYYRQHNAYLGPMDGYNPQQHQSNIMHRLIMVDLIFNLVKSIEAFFGAVTIAWKISNRDEDISTKKLHSSLLRPGENTLQEIKDILSKRNVDRDILCKLCSFPVPGDLEITKKDQKILWRIYDDTLKRLHIYGFFASRYLDEFKEVRNVYSHNMRLLFMDIQQYDGPESVSSMGLLDPKKRRPNYMLLVCESQRKAVGDLTV